MLPYPSGEPHIGHLKNYSLGDAIAHFHRRTGHRVLHPMGYDAFGLPAENNAIKTGVHPRICDRAIDRRFPAGVPLLGDLDRLVAASSRPTSPSYYRWTQWIFLQLYERGLAYRKEAAVNWCPHDQTVLANEQVIDGRCERCGARGRAAPAGAVVLPHHRLRRPAAGRPRHDPLARARQGDAAQLDRAQRRRRGRRSAARMCSRAIDYPVFTTRPDTLFGATFFVMAPEHPDVLTLAAGTEHEQEVTTYVNRASTESAEVRGDADKPKTGVPLGRTVTNPVTGEEIPMYVADYVLMEYGTGAIMARARPRRARLRLRGRLRPADPAGGRSPTPDAGPRRERGVHRPHRRRRAGQLRAVRRPPHPDGLDGIVDWLEREGIGHAIDQLPAARLAAVSRQRYWGCPIPIVYCDRMRDGAGPERTSCR